MVILIKAHRIIDGQISFPGKILANHDSNTDFGFDIFKEENWYNYLVENYGDVKDKYGFESPDIADALSLTFADKKERSDLHSVKLYFPSWRSYNKRKY